MIHYLRAQNGKNLVDCQVTKDDIRVVVDIRVFADTLLELPRSLQEEFIKNVQEIDELRGTWWESVDRLTYKPDPFVASRFQPFVQDWPIFTYVTD